MRHKLRLLLLLVALVSAACGGATHKQSPNANAAHTGTGSTGGGHLRALASVWDVAGPGPDKMYVRIYDLRRQGQFVTLDFGIVCANGSQGCTTNTDFVGGFTTAGEVRTQSGTAGGIQLVDPQSNKEYQPVLDGQGRPDTSALASDITDSSVHLESATFPAPPASVSALDVLFPDGGPAVPSVPISAGAAPAASQVGLGAQAATPAPFTAPAATLPVNDLVLTVGNPAGSDSEAGSQATLTLRTDVLFQFAKSSLTPAASTLLSNAASKIKDAATGAVQVTGYTDSIGPDSVNIPLSQARAAAVVAALKPLTPGTAYQTAGLGAADPVAPNTNPNGSDNPAGRALNRRVTITYHVKAPVKPTPPPQVAPVAPASGGAAQTVTYRPPASGGAASSYTVTADRLYRTGDLVTLELTVNCQSGAQPGSDCTTQFDWSGTPTVPPIPAGTANPADLIHTHLDTLSGIYLTDPVSGAQYIPVFDATRTPLTTQLNPSVPAGTVLTVWLYFPAPSASTSTVTVNLPGGATRIAGVAIAASGP